MSNNIRIILIIIFGIIALYLFNINSDHNLNKSISACIVAQKQTLDSFDPVKAKDYCEKEVKKMIKD
tara:strand:+ start:700 stop:900 length:201 start_codon:yes stop_codon:yes gene_type:complete